MIFYISFLHSIKKIKTTKLITRKTLFSCLSCFLFLLNLNSQIINIPIQNFSPKEYGKNYTSQNFCVVQDKAGYVYFGNANGVLQYDGKSWEFIPVKLGAYVSSIIMDSAGTLYVGSQNEFGYLKSNNSGKLIYHSLSASLKGNDNEFGTVIKCSETSEAIFFQSQEKLFIYRKDSSIKVLNPTTSFHTSFAVNNQFYVRERKLGLLKFSNNKLLNINGGSLFNDVGIFAMLPYNSNGDILIATMEMGLFKYSPKKNNQTEIVTPLKTLNDELILKSGLYGGIKLSDGKFAFNTLNEGLLIVDKNLNISSVINKETGLRVNDVKQVIEDSQHNLWLALNNGISKVTYNSHLSYYADESGLQGNVHATTKNENLFFIATSNGLFYQQNNTNKYSKLNSINGQIWVLIKKENTFIAAGDEGIYEVEGLKTKKVSSIKCRSLNFDSIHRIWLIGNENGIVLLNEKWKHIQSIDEVRTEIISILINYDQKNKRTNIWAGTLQQGIFNIIIDSPLNVKVNYIGLPKGLTNECIIPFTLNNQIIFGSTTGIYSITKDLNYELMPLFNSLAFDQKVTALNQTQQNVWLSINNRIVLYNTLTSKTLEIPFRIVDKGQIHSFYQDSNVCWISADDGLIRYDILNNRSFSNSFKVQIRKVNCGKDSIIYHGNNNIGEKNIQQLNYDLNSIYFEFAGIFFEDGSKNTYSYKLNGQDSTWSNWSAETKATFTNLKEGKYTFFIKSKNIYGAESNTASYSFIIKTPWHRTWIAYALYAILFILAVYIFIRNRTKKLILEKEELEKIVLERTKEIILQKDEISLQKHFVEEKHKEITDSINYAERIQRSLLASKNLLDENLKDYFIFFQPKDVVSGDFYWASQLENNHFCFVTADSTGHGVPGAIMSILNINALKDAVNLKLTNPSDILNKSRESIINTLANDGSSEGGKDGMDCSALCFDFKNQILYMSLANNPVWVIRNKELIEFKPDKMPIGKHDKDHESFKLNTFPLQKGDLIYTITDGYADQFGGNKNKKFNSKNLKELLLELTYLPMQEQKENLKNNFENWKGNHEQIDDVTVIGIKI